MPQVTYYVALPFRYLDGEIIAGEPQECRDGFKARSVAAILADVICIADRDGIYAHKFRQFEEAG